MYRRGSWGEGIEPAEVKVDASPDIGEVQGAYVRKTTPMSLSIDNSVSSLLWRAPSSHRVPTYFMWSVAHWYPSPSSSRFQYAVPAAAPATNAPPTANAAGAHFDQALVDVCAVIGGAVMAALGAAAVVVIVLEV